MQKIGVKDSKAIKSDKKIAEIAKKIKSIIPNNYSIVAIGPEAYNRLYEKMANLNKLLAWGHARALENLLDKVPSCTEVIADKFGNERLIKNALMNKGKTVTLIQITKGERDIAVAAASILARNEFVERMDKLSSACQTQLPKGASLAVEQVATEIAKSAGLQKLESLVKKHFKTFDKIKESLTHI